MGLGYPNLLTGNKHLKSRVFIKYKERLKIFRFKNSCEYCAILICHNLFFIRCLVLGSGYWSGAVLPCHDSEKPPPNINSENTHRDLKNIFYYI